MRITNILIFFVSLAASASAATYYVDFGTGNDSSAGTSKSAPWKHAPGMNGCTGACSSASLNPSDAVIFKGGVRWDHTAFPFMINTAGSDDSHRIYYGVDKTWFAGSSWTQPVFDEENNIPSGYSMVVFGANATWLTLDNVEIKNFRIENSTDPLDRSMIQFMYGAVNITVTNSVIHSWTATVGSCSSGCDDQTGAVTGLGPMTNILLDHVNIYNDTANKNIGSCTFNVPGVQYSTLHDCTEGIFGGCQVHDNHIYNIYQSGDNSAHENGLQIDGQNCRVYNNTLHDVMHGTGLYILPDSAGQSVAYNMYIYNNVVYNTVPTPCGIEPERIGNGTVTAYVVNNLCNGQGGAAWSDGSRPGNNPIATMYRQNNFWISDLGTPAIEPSGAVANLITDHEVSLTQAQAAQQGYTATNAFAPTSNGVSVNAGANFTSRCGSMPGLCADIHGAVRPTTGAWDDSAYQYGSGGTTAQPGVSSLSCTPTSVQTPGTTACTVTLKAAASASVIVSLTSSQSALSVPASVTVSTGAQTANFSASAAGVASNTTANITASANGSSASSSLTLSPTSTGSTSPSLVALGVNPSSVTSGGSVTGTVTLSAAAPSGGIAVAIASSNSALAPVPSSVTVAGGATTANFSIKTGSTTSTSSITLTASSSGITKSATLTVNPTSTSSVPGLVAAYSFNEGTGTTVADLSGLGNNGAISGATWSTSGRFGNALSFNGTNSLVTVNDSASLDLTTAVTMEAWVYMTQAADWQAVAIKERPNGLSYSLYANTYTSTPAGTINVGDDVNLYGGSPIPLNTWTHVATTYDGSVLRLYVNGQLVNSQPVSGSMPVSTGALRIGGDLVWGEYFGGLIDEVRIYKRALSASEIATDMKTPL